jgi:hypothetical protein
MLNLARYVYFIPRRIDVICTEYEGIALAGGQAQQHIPNARKWWETDN